MTAISLKVTGDGSHTLYHQDLDETYHSTHGALSESMYVFITQGLDYWHIHYPDKPVSILEVGFGTGLNAILAFQWSMLHKVPVTYTTLEPFPLPAEITDQLNYMEFFNMPELKSTFKNIHSCNWQEWQKFSAYFNFLKKQEKLEEAFLDKYDVVFFDAFAPNRQSDIWQAQNIEKIATAMKPGSLLVSYCAQGQFKRNLLAAGLPFDALPGPPGKKQMVRAIREEQ
jgi:tRNA U34 5-methylaminomethyl-2-thiouridine-forming methyltransferase MnmC